MMTVHAVASDKPLLVEIADYLLTEKLVANAMLSEAIHFRSVAEEGSILDTKQYSLKCISKSLLFPLINNTLRKKYGAEMPLLYSELIILIDPLQTETIVASLKLV